MLIYLLVMCAILFVFSLIGSISLFLENETQGGFVFGVIATATAIGAAFSIVLLNN